MNGLQDTLLHLASLVARHTWLAFSTDRCQTNNAFCVLVLPVSAVTTALVAAFTGHFSLLSFSKGKVPVLFQLAVQPSSFVRRARYEQSEEVEKTVKRLEFSHVLDAVVCQLSLLHLSKLVVCQVEFHVLSPQCSLQRKVLIQFQWNNGS